jgi:hypothetical protein
MDSSWRSITVLFSVDRVGWAAPKLQVSALRGIPRGDMLGLVAKEVVAYDFINVPVACGRIWWLA